MQSFFWEGVCGLAVLGFKAVNHGYNPSIHLVPMGGKMNHYVGALERHREDFFHWFSITEE